MRKGIGQWGVRCTDRSIPQMARQQLAYMGHALRSAAIRHIAIHSMYAAGGQIGVLQVSGAEQAMELYNVKACTYNAQAHACKIAAIHGACRERAKHFRLYKLHSTSRAEELQEPRLPAGVAMMVLI